MEWCVSQTGNMLMYTSAMLTECSTDPYLVR